MVFTTAGCVHFWVWGVAERGRWLEMWGELCSWFSLGWGGLSWVGVCSRGDNKVSIKPNDAYFTKRYIFSQICPSFYHIRNIPILKNLVN